MLMVVAGYEDGNDADTLRRDPMFKLALDRPPSGDDLCSQSTISRLENLPDRRALLRLGRALLDQYCGSFRTVPKRIVLDIDDTFDFPAIAEGRRGARDRNDLGIAMLRHLACGSASAARPASVPSALHTAHS
jgi:hypothetical protein